MISLNVLDANSQAIEATLDDELFYIILNWNSSNFSWSMDIRNSSYVDIIRGVAVVVNFMLTFQFRYSTMPRGELMAVADNDRNGPIPRDGFTSKKYELIYIPFDELPTNVRMLYAL